MKLQQTQKLNMRTDYPNLDLAKIVCALLVVVIHTSPLDNTSALAGFYLDDVIARIAVPLFFAISSFLFFRSIAFENGRIVRSGSNFRRLLRVTWKNLRLYIIWSLIYLVILLPEWHKTGWWGLHAVKDWFHSFLLIGSYYHLWYLLALIAALPALYLLLSLIPVSKIWIIAAGLWIMECLTYSYSWIGVDEIPIAAFIGEKMPVVFDAAFRAVPLMAIGAILSQQRRKPAKLRVCVAAFFLCVAEASLLHFLTPNENKYSYLFTTPFMTAAVMTVLVYGKQLSVPEKWQYRLRDMSLLIYCLHPMICYSFRKWELASGPVLWLSVTMLSIGIAYLWAEMKRYFSKRKD